MSPKILVTNDDGPFSPGLSILREAVNGLGNIYTVVPETPKSATGLGLTLHKPVRVNKLKVNDEPIYLVSGTPSDVIYIAMNVVTGRPDLVVSGVNIGDNLSIQVILSSGTLGAVLQASIEGIPGVAFSASVDSPEELEEPEYRGFILRASRIIVEGILKNGFPSEVDAFNVNFPPVITDEVAVVRPARRRFSTAVVKRKDPQGRPYYWLYGQPVDVEEGTDVQAVLDDGKIAITPISLGALFEYKSEKLSELVRYISERLSGERS
ncbi:MAG: 5'/3'-nucleotidase SurE [Infirmifilum sp.]